MNNRYLFLDIDGVLNSERTVFAYDKLIHAGMAKHDILLGKPTLTYFDPIAVMLLKKAQEKIGFKIVISSTWRYTLNKSDFDVIFSEYGWDTTDIIVGKTDTDGKIRGDEIKRWLNQYAKYPYEYCILDDSSDMLESQLNNFVQTTFEDGLSFDNYQKIFAIFGESCDDSFSLRFE